MKNVYLLTTFKIVEGKSAGSARLMNIARALAGGGCRVYLCSSTLNQSINESAVVPVEENIFRVGSEENSTTSLLHRIKNRFFNLFATYFFLRDISRFIRQHQGQQAIYYYPDTEFSMDLLVWAYLKRKQGFNIYADINELRKTMLGNRCYARNPLKKTYQFFSFKIEGAQYRLAEKMSRFYDGLVVISTNLEKYFAGYNRNLLRIPILSNCPEEKAPLPPAYAGLSFEIGFTGQLATRKEGFENFYQALSMVSKSYPQIKLNLYGPIYEPVERELLLDLLPARYGLSGKISYHGNIDQRLVENVLKSQHLLVLPRPLNPQTHFGFSTKLSEYLASGTPVLITDVSDNALYIQDGVSGLVVPPGDPSEMARKIITLIQHYQELAPKLSANGFLVAQQHFHYKNYQQALTNFFFKSRKQITDQSST
jgi:glycosyltransferase involved in cell wall biosynthesis